jgi:anti-sigma factor RsiW
MRTKELRRLSRYRDGELSAAERARVGDWLARSAEAREARDAFDAVGRMLRTEEVPAPGTAEAMRADVLRRIRLEGAAAAPAPGLFGSRLRWVGSAAALLTVFAMGAWLFSTAIVAPPRVAADVEWVDTEVKGASTMIYHDDDVGLTVIWLMEQENGTKPHGDQ